MLFPFEVVLLLSIFCIWSGLAFAQNTAASEAAASEPVPLGSAGKLSENVRYIPYAALEETWQKSPKGILISRSEFERIKREKEAFLVRRPASPIPQLDTDFVHGRSSFTGKIAEKVGEFKGTFVFEMPVDRWALFPLPAGDIGLVEVLLDDQPVGVTVSQFAGIQDSESPKGRVELLQQQRKSVAAVSRKTAQQAGRKGQPNDFFLAVRGAGRHTVTVKFLVPQIDDPERNEVTFRIPRLPMNSFAISIDTPGQYGEVDRSEGTECLEEIGRTLLQGVLGPTDRFTIRWAPKSGATLDEPTPLQGEPTPIEAGASAVVQVPSVREEPRVYADSGTLLSVGEGFIRSETSVRLRITRSGIDGVSFLIPKGTELLDVQSKNLESYRTEDLGTMTRVICVFSSQVRQFCEVSMVCDTKMSDTSQTVALPVHRVEGVERDCGNIGMEARTSIEIRKSSGSDAGNLQVSSIDVTDLPIDLTRRAVRPILLSYRYFSPPVDPSLAVKIIRHKDAQTLTAVMDLIRATTYLGLDRQALTSLDMVVKNNGQQYLEAWLATGSEILSAELEGSPVKPSSRDETSYLIPLGGNHTRRSAASAFHVRITFRSPIPELGWTKRMRFPLPKLDIRASRLEWTIFAPEWNTVIPMPSSVDKIHRKVEFIPFGMVKDLFRQLLTPSAIVFLLVLFILKRVFEYFGQASDRFAPEISLRSVVSGLAVILVIAVLASVAGPMVGSITDQGSGSRSMGRMFESAPSSSLSSPSPKQQTTELWKDEYQAPSPSVADSIESRGGSSMNESEGMVMDKRRESKTKRAFEGKASMNGPVATPSSPAVRRLTAGRDRGALPVDPKIPQTQNSLFFYKNDLNSQEEASVKLTVIWQPLRIALSILLGAIGLVVFIILQTLAARGSGFLAWLLVVVCSGLILGAEEQVTGFQEPFILALLGCFALYIVLRVYRFAASKWHGAAAIVLAAALFGSPQVASAVNQADGNEKDPRVEQTIDVFVPYSQLGDRVATDSSLVFLRYEDFKYLRDLGIPEPDPSLWMPPVSVTYVSCSLSGEVNDDLVSLKLRMVVQLLGKGFKQIPFPTSRVGIKSLQIDGQPAVLMAGSLARQTNQIIYQQEMQSNVAQSANIQQKTAITQLPPAAEGVEHSIVTDKEGVAVIEAELVKDLFSRGQAARTREGFSLGLPPFGAADLDLLINRQRQFVEIEPAAQVTTSDLATATRVVAALQPTRSLRVEWRDRVKVAPPPVQSPEPASQPALIQEAKVFADHELLFAVSEGVIAIRDNVVLNIEQSPVGEFLFKVPKGVEIMDVSGGDVASWAIKANEKDQELKVILHAQRRDQVAFTLELERATPSINGEFPLDCPRLVAVGPKARLERQKGYFGVEVSQGIEARIVGANPATMVDPGELPAFVRDQAQGFIAYAFKFLEPVSPKINLTKHQEVAVSTAQIDGAIAQTLVSRDGKTLTQLALIVRNNNNQFLIFEKLPSNMEVLSVVLNGEPVKPGIGDGGEVYIPLIRSPQTGKILQPFGVVIFLQSRIQPFGRRGELDLHLPAMSLDASELTWVVSMPEGFHVEENSSDFNKGYGSVTNLPGIVRGEGQAIQKMSNVMTQSVMKAGDAGDSDRKIEGVLPVVLTIPTTGNQVFCNKKLVSAKGPTRLHLVYAREWLMNQLFLAFSLVIAGLLCWSIVGVYRGTWSGTIPALFLLVGSGGVVKIAESLFGSFSEIPGMLTESFVTGLECGFAGFVIWILLAPGNPETGEPSKPSEPSKPFEPSKPSKPASTVSVSVSAPAPAPAPAPKPTSTTVPVPNETKA